MTQQLYGQLASETRATENAMCRQIVREVSLFGITDRQRVVLIYLLAMELEDAAQLQAITSCVKECAGGSLFVSTQDGDTNGQIDI